MKIINGTFSVPFYNEDKGIKGATIRITHGAKEGVPFALLSIEGELDGSPANLIWRYGGTREGLLKRFLALPAGKMIRSTVPHWTGTTKSGYQAELLPVNHDAFGVGEFVAEEVDDYGVIQIKATKDTKWLETESNLGRDEVEEEDPDGIPF